MKCLRYSALLLLLPLFLLGVAVPQEKPADSFPPIRNTQNPKDVPPTPQDAASKITVPPGFRVTLFAGEPDVQQPIAMSIDDRGRLWVAECYTYSGQSGVKAWDVEHRDRLVILEDVNHDGKFDKRTVFSDKLHNLSSLAHGFGGVFVLCAPHLLFIPDRNGDDVPDGPPEVVLDGFNFKQVGHNVVNGLMWGPDGWLYGRHGILATSLIGRPGASDKERAKINCGIWRYHPTKKIVEAVCHGTTNPWGMDYNEQGELFFTNNVNGHLWHVIPGAHYVRMYGEDFNPRIYQLIDQHADHYHWDTKKSWTESRDPKGKEDLGGGHSHVGGMIYLADTWPKEYRGQLFMCNTHGRRVNINKLERHGSGYVGRRAPDFFFANNPWFRGIDLKLAPDGNVYISDWCDLGECHDHDGVHRTSGRIYKIIHGQVTPPKIADVSKLSDQELLHLQTHTNEYYVRTARRVLQERVAAGKDLRTIRAELARWVRDRQRSERERLRAFWTLRATGGADWDLMWACLHQDHSEALQVWALRFLVEDGEMDRQCREAYQTLARKSPSGLVRLYLAAALQRVPLLHRAELIAALSSRAEDANDHNLPLMIWYGTEPWVAYTPQSATGMVWRCQIPLVRRFMARRLGEYIATPHAIHVEVLLRPLLKQPEAAQLDVLRGLTEAFRGYRKLKAPPMWAGIQPRLLESQNQELSKLARDLGVVFGDGRSLAELYRVAQDGKADGEVRRAALRVLIDARPDDLRPVLLKLLGDRVTMGAAVRGLAVFDHPDIPTAILRHYQQLAPEDRTAAIATLTARPSYARALLKGVAEGRVPRVDVSAFHARQIHSLGDAELQKELAKVWGEIRSSNAEKKQLIDRYKQLLTTDYLKKADQKRGHALYKQVCAACHKLHGEGETNGPDLTGGNRDNLDYLLENIVDPSAVVAVDYRMSVVTLKNGRVLNGVVGSKLGKTLTVQTQTERLTLETADIDEIQPTLQSLMPDGLLQPLSNDQVRDLFGYLMKR